MTELIRPGDRSPQVLDVQTRLRALGFAVDDEPGLFGDGTRRALKTFQQHRGVDADGIVGPHTWDELVEASWRLGDRNLYLTHPPMRGDDVLALQSRLNALGFDSGSEDGVFGANTLRAVRGFQKEYGIPEDGIFGPKSHASLIGLRVERPGTSARLREELRRAERSGLHDALVIIDPGHGGADPGERGPRGTNESDVCWDLAGRLAERLVGAGARVRFTRAENEDPTVTERAQLANSLGGDLFVSLHLNRHEEEMAEGACTYYFAGSRVGEALAEKVQAELVSLGAKDCRSHARAYPILKQTRMPAVLVEPAFVSNPDEEKKLDDPEFRNAAAAAVVTAIHRYYADAG
ncbi:MAG: N-acetylmuramoyl-L-alanine amidase [Actinomycetota bacterium]